MASTTFTAAFITETIERYDHVIRQAIHNGDVIAVMRANELAMVSFDFLIRHLVDSIILLVSEAILSNM
jgi:hypothetical protein